MKPICDEASLYASIQAVKRHGPEFVTNLYAAWNRVKQWIEDKSLVAVESDRTLCVLRKDRDFYHLYFFSTNIDALAHVLAGWPAGRIDRRTLVTDLVGKGDAIESIQAVFRRHGFQDYTTLFRLSRVVRQPIAAEVSDEDVVFAGPSDAPTILGRLEASFDRYAEQLPTTMEIESAADKGSILIVRREKVIAGILFFEVTGQTSVLRYWLVAPGFRDQHVGSKLMQRYYRECTGVRRFLLWVIAGNDNAVKRYHHYGYDPDGLLDHVMIKKCP
jgi:GNAT superfamily N-acetyltransferase